MSHGSSWFSWLSVPFFAPLSGAVMQDLSTKAYQGVREIETDVIEKVGSFGKQLGILSEALVEMSDRLAEQDAYFAAKPEQADRSDEPSPLEKLRAMVKDVAVIKEQHKDAARRNAEEALTRLKTLDNDAYEALRARLRA